MSNKIKITISSETENSFAFNKLKAGMIGYLKSLCIPINHLDSNTFVIEADHLVTQEQQDNYDKGGEAYRYALACKGFVGTEDQYMESLLDSYNKLQLIPFYE